MGSSEERLRRAADRGDSRSALRLVGDLLAAGVITAEELRSLLPEKECKTWVRFERGRDDVIGPTFGPYDWAQLTYSSLRVSDAASGGLIEDGELAAWLEDAGEWFLSDESGEHEGEFYSDVVIFCGERKEPYGVHDCDAARTTVQGSGEQVRWEGGRWAPTGLIWDSSRGAWIEASGNPGSRRRRRRFPGMER